MTGNAGADIFAFVEGDDTMVIADFAAGVDHLALVNFDENLTIEGVIPYVSQQDDDVVISGGTQEIRIENTLVSDLSADDVMILQV